LRRYAHFIVDRHQKHIAQKCKARSHSGEQYEFAFADSIIASEEYILAVVGDLIRRWQKRGTGRQRQISFLLWSKADLLHLGLLRSELLVKMVQAAYPRLRFVDLKSCPDIIWRSAFVDSLAKLMQTLGLPTGTPGAPDLTQCAGNRAVFIINALFAMVAASPSERSAFAARNDLPEIDGGWLPGDGVVPAYVARNRLLRDDILTTGPVLGPSYENPLGHDEQEDTVLARDFREQRRRDHHETEPLDL
jgi:hypothetical protein